MYRPKATMSLCDENGQLFFIDPIIKLKKSAVEVLNYLYDTRCTD